MTMDGDTTDPPAPTATTLRERMNARRSSGPRFSVDEVAHVGVALCQALGAAQEPTIHGGVKPECILLGEDGSVTVTGAGGGAVPKTERSTMVDTLAACYLAPEQLRGCEDVDRRADQYAVASVLYEMLTGEAPAGRVKSAIERRQDTPRQLSDALDRALESDRADRFTDTATFAAALAGHPAARTGRKRLWVVMSFIVLAAAGGVTFPSWRGPVRTMLREALRDPEAQAAAETARVHARAAALGWQRIADVLPSGQTRGGITQAAECLSAGSRHFAAMAYGKAEMSFKQAAELYESQVAAATQSFRDEPARVADAARDLVTRRDALERALYDRAAEAVRRVEGCERNLRSARNRNERAAIEARKRDAEAEQSLLDRLRSLARAHVFSAAARAEVSSQLSLADQQLEAGRYGEALSLYAELGARLDQVLVWPDQVEQALRTHSAVAGEMERVFAALGPAAQEVVGDGGALDEATRHLSRGDEELAAGRVPEAVTLYESARARLSDVKAHAADGLLTQAEAYDRERKGTAAMLVLEELLALDPGHAAGQQLRQTILAYRLTNSIGIELVFIPPGEFVMGSPTDEPGRDDDERQRRVRIAVGFYMAATEVTQAQWLAVMDDNPSAWQGNDLPVEGISWDDALTFCRRLGDREGQPYRLPTEAEWEYACRAGTTTPFFFGETIASDEANYDGEKIYGSGSKGTFLGKTAAVASYAPNAWGLYDMHGNVWEWCPDGYEYYTPSPVRPPADQALIEGRVLRGGSWRHQPRFCRSANRVRDLEGRPLSTIGLRVVVESE